ncbi:MAG: hypothetical protein LBR14_00205 [Clostridiales Family XIII bacterium]|nr:hypothetical protein [Clostridiales Family XIII bacterium]
MKEADPQMIALAFYAPALLLSLRALPYDADHPVARESLDLLRAHMQYFRTTYGKKPEVQDAKE